MPRLNVIHATVLGLVLAAAAAFLYPAALLRGLGVAEASFATVGLVRLAGVLALALAAVLWSVRRWLCTWHGVPTLRVLAVICGASSLMLVAQRIPVWQSPLDVVPAIFAAMLAVEYLLVARRLTRVRALRPRDG